MSETILRTTIKTVSYRVAGSSLTFLISYILTGELIVSAAISITEIVLKPGLYWVHERGWNGIMWGRFIDKQQTQLNQILANLDMLNIK